jgi:hypothetical protein
MVNVIDLKGHEFQKERSELRKEIINIFLEEKPGTGRGDEASRYHYIVKEVDNFVVYLKRPAQFNNGFDFTVNVEGVNFNPQGKATTRPTHQNVIDDLIAKQKENPILFDELKEQICLIYSCQPVVKDDFAFTVGINSMVLLECIKWLFIEQDVTYWNYSGRSMFYNGILDSIK